MTADTAAPRGQSRFVGNTAALGTATIVSTALTLLQVKILATFLVPESFGLFAALRGFSLLVAMLAANGLPQLLVRFLPYHESRKGLARAVMLSGVCYFVPLFLLTVFIFVIETNRSFFFQFVPAGWLSSAGGAGSLIFWFYAATLGVTLKLILYGGLNGLRRLPAQVTLDLASLLVQVAWIYAWRDQLTLARLFMILGVTSLAACAAGLPWYFWRLSRDVASGDGSAHTNNDGASNASQTTRKVGGDLGYRGYWIGATGMSLVAVAFTDVDRFVLSQVLALEVLSQFHIGSRVLRLTNRFLSVPVLAFQPEVTRLDAEGRSQSIETSAKVFFKFNTAVAAVAAFAMWALAPEIVRLVSTAQYDAAVPLLRIMAVSVPLAAMTAPLTSVMKALDQVRRALYCDLSWAVVYLALLLTLGGAYGLHGAGAAMVAASIVQLLLALSLSKLRLGARLPLAVAGKVTVCGAVAFAPLLLAGAILPLSPAVLAVKSALLVLALFLFRVTARATGVFTVEERDGLVALLDKRGLGRVVRRIL